ncbi:unnamed protein product, partial [Thlaspi arvense]
VRSSLLGTVGHDIHTNDMTKLGISRYVKLGTLSVDGRIVTSFSRKCSICSSAYPRLIDMNFTVWIQVGKLELQHCQKLAMMILP